MNGGSHDVVVVDIDGRRYGLAHDQVERIVRMVTVTPLPGAPEVVSGVIDLAGETVPVVDPRIPLRHERRDPRVTDQLVIARARTRTVAVWVDRAVELLSVAGWESIPAAVAGDSRIAGVSRTTQGLLVITDLDAFLSLDEEVALESALAAI